MFLAACTQVDIPSIPTPTPRIPFTATNTSLPPTALPSLTPTLIPSQTPPPCDAFQAEFCITDGNFFLQRPIRPPNNDRIEGTYRYGSTANGTRDPHHGVEFDNPSGTPVYAAAAGTVVFAGPDLAPVYAPWPNFYGNLVVLQHDGGWFTLYAHLSKVEVRAGQAVAPEDKLGEVGRTGGAIGSHLHFETRRGDAEDYFSTQNPELWLLPTTDAAGNPTGVLAISIMDQEHRLIPHAQLTIGHYMDKTLAPTKIYYVTTYSQDLLNGEENAVLGDLPAGHYRIAIEWNGRIYERWVEVQSGKLTQVIFVVQ